jgi:disulfide oxidoreductase YuzD
MMKPDIKILCPGRKCGKCRRMIARVEEAMKVAGVDADIQIVNNFSELIKYKTWILPTLIINNEIVARGYIPGVDYIIKCLKP